MAKLFIIPGHGAGDNGACGNGFKEAERVRALAQKIKDLGGDNVMLADFSVNAYKSNTIGKGLIPKGYIILELHLDSSTSKNAKGGHIIIHSDFDADKYDKALAKMISEMFPGRSKIVDGRSDLANVNRAANKDYNYRLMECCFISNADDIKKFNANIDELAKKILSCFDITVKKADKPTTTIKKGDKVKVNKGAKDYNGKAIAGFVYNGTYTVDEITDNRAVLDKKGICTAFNVKDLTIVKTNTSSSPTIKVGAAVKIKKGAKTYTGGKLASFIYSRKYKVKEISGNRVVITYLGITIAAINKKDLTLV